MMIDSYSFGRIVIDGKEYTSDVIISPGGGIIPWWRREGHRVCYEDLGVILGEDPQVLIFGSGYSGAMRVPAELKERLESLGIEVIVEHTKAACETYNNRSSGRRVWAALHLTC